MDLDLIPIAREILGARVHDSLRCQEFWWLTMDGIPLRDDISLVKSAGRHRVLRACRRRLPMSDSFPVSSKGHVLNSQGRI